MENLSGIDIENEFSNLLDDGKKKDQNIQDRNHQQTIESLVKALNENQDLALENEQGKYKPVEGEVIRRISINCRIGNVIINDQFEWDINNPENSPEDFAYVIVADLGLGSEFIAPIAQ